jgi:hypothetical protein
LKLPFSKFRGQSKAETWVVLSGIKRMDAGTKFLPPIIPSFAIVFRAGRERDPGWSRFCLVALAAVGKFPSRSNLDPASCLPSVNWMGCHSLIHLLLQSFDP